MGSRKFWTGVVIALIVASLTSVDAVAAPPTGALTDAQKTEKALDSMAAWVPRAEEYWAPTDQPDPSVALPVTTDVGHFKASGSGVDYYRGNGDIAQVYAVLLSARPTQASFGGVPRATVQDHLRQTIRYLALSNKLWNAAHAHPWGSWPLANPWQESLETYNWTYAAWLDRESLDSATYAAAAEVAAREADAVAAKEPPNATPGNTEGEVNAWNTPLPIVATLLNPTSSRVPVWRESAIRSALNASSAPGDDTATTPTIDGKTLGTWVSTANLTSASDLLIENHGFVNPSYQAYVPLAVTEAASFAQQGGQSMPEAFSFRVEQIWEHVLGRFYDGNGDLIAPAGQDWTSKDFQSLAYLSAMSTRFKRVDASVLEARALSHLTDRQAAHANGSYLEGSIGYESTLAARLATLYNDHLQFGPSPQPEASEYSAARAATAAVVNYPSASLTVGRLGRSFISISWSKARPMALVVPNGDDPAAAHHPLFSAYAPESLIGAPAQSVQPTYSCECTGNHIASAGVLADRDFAISAFPDGIVMLHEAGAGGAFPYYAEAIPGFAPSPTVYAASGSSGDLGGNWANLDDMMAMVVRYGQGLNASPVTLAGGPALKLTGARETTSGTRLALMVPFLSHTETAALSLKIAAASAPSGWSSATALPGDGSLRISYVRWSGPTTASLKFTDPRGAPVTRTLATISGNTATTAVEAPGVYAHAEILNFFLKSSSAITAKTEVGDLLHLFNPTATAASVAITWVTAGVERSTTVTVPAKGELLLHRSGSELIP